MEEEEEQAVEMGCCTRHLGHSLSLRLRRLLLLHRQHHIEQHGKVLAASQALQVAVACSVRSSRVAELPHSAIQPPHRLIAVAPARVDASHVVGAASGIEPLTNTLLELHGGLAELSPLEVLQASLESLAQLLLSGGSATERRHRQPANTERSEEQQPPHTSHWGKAGCLLSRCSHAEVWDQSEGDQLQQRC